MTKRKNRKVDYDAQEDIMNRIKKIGKEKDELFSQLTKQL